MTDISPLFSPIEIGSLSCPNRVFMAPLTRDRAQGDGTPKAVAETYYRQRASAGLIVSEGTQVSALGKGYLDTPGIYTEDHVAAWKRITDAVHAGGGRIFCQLWHVGRISHVSLLPEGTQPVSPTNRRAEARTFTAAGFEPVSQPVALTTEGIAQTVADFGHAADCARRAGFDGVEVHAANGYLLDQFLRDGVNDRTDAYGGPVENRMRLLAEVLDACVAHWPSGRVGVRLSPLSHGNEMSDSDPEATFGAVYRMLDTRDLAYLHVVEVQRDTDWPVEHVEMMDRMRGLYSGTYIANGGYDGARAAARVAAGKVDAVAFGRDFLANPDLPERLRQGAPLNAPDADTFFGGDETGYTDYPSLPG